MLTLGLSIRFTIANFFVCFVFPIFEPATLQWWITFGCHDRSVGVGVVGVGGGVIGFRGSTG
jgi:hypothetical protein